MHSGSSKSQGYPGAVKALNSLQSNADVLASIQADGPQPTSLVFDHTNYYLRRLGYKPSDLNRLNAIHISGTKGKGSTAVLCSSILNSLNPNSTVGLYTSPHLVAVRERIRINGRPISELSFTKYFWEVWNRFGDGHGESYRSNLPIRPAYFRYLTYMAYHVFLSESVDATVLEVGVGGLLDPTNLIPSPLVTGVTSLGLDHQHVLGHSIQEIAGHKGGIFKPGVPALAVVQEYPETMDVLKARATELKSSSFTVIPQNPMLDNVELGLAGTHQKTNASLAIALIHTYLASPRLPSAYQHHATSLRDGTASSISASALPPLPSDPSPSVSPAQGLPHPPALSTQITSPIKLASSFVQTLKETKWPGRCQRIIDPTRPGVTWSLDGAHTVDSMAYCGRWWKSLLDLKYSVPSNSSNDLSRKQYPNKRILIFNCTSGRNGKALLETLLDSLEGCDPSCKNVFDKVVITSNATYLDGNSKGDLTAIAQLTALDGGITVQYEIAAAWASIVGSTSSAIVTHSIEEAIAEIHTSDHTPIEVLVTGSLHLIGGVLEVAGLQDLAL